MGKKNKLLNNFTKTAVGVGTLGVGLGVTGAIIGRTSTIAPAIAPISGAVSTVASFTPIAVTGIIGSGLIGDD